MENLEQYAKKLKEGLDGIQPDFDAGPVDASFQQAADDFTDYPSLIYDGPFSDHIGQQEPKLLAGQSEVRHRATPRTTRRRSSALHRTN